MSREHDRIAAAEATDKAKSPSTDYLEAEFDPEIARRAADASARRHAPGALQRKQADAAQPSLSETYGLRTEGKTTKERWADMDMLRRLTPNIQHKPANAAESKQQAAPAFPLQGRTTKERVGYAAMLEQLGVAPEVQQKTADAATTSPAAIHAAAAEGVATPARPLPHADKIRASFAPTHDVSHIRAHIDPESTRAMGAEAYATGNDIVFAKEPDEELAAHEAAHVVQQAQGVNLKGGVGEAGDAHEQNADAVAHRVVAGAPAADLLGPATADQQARTSTQPIQQKPASSQDQPYGRSAAGPDDKTRARAIVTGYQAAQHELDKTGSPDDTLAHLLHVGNVSPEYAGESDFERVQAAADSFALALHARSQRSPDKYQRLVQLNEQIRTNLGLAKASKARTNLAGGTDASYARAAIGPALDALALRTRHALAFLEQIASDDQGQRAGLIERVAGDIDFTSEYVVGLLDELPGQARSGLAGAASAAAHAVGRVLRWVRTRPAHEQLEATLLRGVGVFDRALISMGTEPIANRDEVPLTEGQRHAAEEEDAEIEQAFSGATEAIDSLYDGQQSKIHLLDRIAVLDDLPKPPAFVPTLLKAILDGVLSTSIGQFAKILGSSGTVSLPKPAKTTGLPQAAETIGLSPPPDKADFGPESVWSIGLGSLKNAVAAKLGTPPGGGGVDPTKLALHYFCDALDGAERARKDAYTNKLSEMKQRSAITAAQLRDIQHAVKSKTAELAEGYLQQITTAWAQYLAQSRLGTTRMGNEKVSKMDDYFGEERPGGRVFGTSHAGGGGVLAVVLRIERGAAKPTVDTSATRIIGLNSALKEQVLAGANHEFDKVELPKEVHVEVEFARATIALDEQNRFRDVINWHEVLRHVGGLSAYRFWQLWGKGLKVS